MNNILLLCLDTVRKDYFDRYAPRLQARADISFAQCRAASGWSIPSHASMLTGRLPHEHGVHAHQPDFTRLDVSDTLMGDLPEHRTIGTSANVYAGSAYGFDTLFDVFTDVSRDHRYPEGLDVAKFLHDNSGSGLRRYLNVLRACLDHQKPVASLANAVALQSDTLARDGPFDLPLPVDDGARILRRKLLHQIRTTEEPIVLFANFMDAHEPHYDTREYDRDLYSVPRGWDSRELDVRTVINSVQQGSSASRTEFSDDAIATAVERYRKLYGAAVEYLDRTVASLIDDVRSMTDHDTTVVVTADHGENLAYPADENLFGHVSSLSEGVLHVPLLVINPPGEHPDREDDFVSHLSLRRLLAGLARGELPDITGAKAPAEVVGITPGNEQLFADAPERWDRMLRCVYANRVKHVWDDTDEHRAYRLDPSRPCWQHRRQTPPPVPSWGVDCFSQTSTAYRRALDATGSTDRDIDESVERRLDELGYR
jgi:arylsulfatase A-like enzyme